MTTSKKAKTTKVVAAPSSRKKAAVSKPAPKAKTRALPETETVVLEPKVVEDEQVGKVEQAAKEPEPSKDGHLRRLEKLEKDIKEAFNRISLILSDSRVALGKAEEVFGMVDKLNESLENLQALHDENVGSMDKLVSSAEEINFRVEDMSARISELESVKDELRLFCEEIKTLRDEDTHGLQESEGHLDMVRSEITASLEELKSRFENEIVRIGKALDGLTEGDRSLRETIEELSKSNSHLSKTLEQKLSVIDQDRVQILDLIDASRQDSIKLADEAKREFLHQLDVASSQMSEDYNSAVLMFESHTSKIRDELNAVIEDNQKKIQENFDLISHDSNAIEEKIGELREANEERIQDLAGCLSRQLDEARKAQQARLNEATRASREADENLDNSLAALKEEERSLESELSVLRSREEEDAHKISELLEDRNLLFRNLEELGKSIIQVDGKAGEINSRMAEEFEKTRLAWQKIEEVLADAQGAIARTREAHARVDELKEMINETRVNLDSLMAQMRENTLMSEANLDRASLAMKLFNEIEEKSRKIIIPVDDMLASIDEFEKLPETTDLGFELNDLLQVMIKHAASDLHLKVGAPPTVRLEGELIPVGNQVLTERDCRRLILSAMTRMQRRKLAEGRGVDLSYSLPGSRFRISAFLQKGSVSAVFRRLRMETPTMEELNLPLVLKKFASYGSGVILVTGPAGSGKSTTLAALLDYINVHKKVHIITLEDPIEFLHKDKLSIVTQREIGIDAGSFPEALLQAMRQDPDVLFIGELKDSESIINAVLAAQSGRLVLAAMHTPDTVSAVERLVEVFSGEQQKQFRLLLASTLKGCVSMKLLNRSDEQGRIPACEVLTVTPTIANLIREGKLQDIYPLLVQSVGEGLQTFASSLTRLYEAGLITKEEALCHADQPMEFRLFIEGRAGVTHAVASEASQQPDETMML